MKKLRICFFTVLLILFLPIAFFSCKTIPIQYLQEPFLLLGDTFSIYTIIDAKRDKKLLEDIFNVYFENLNNKTKDSILQRTSRIYAGFSLNEKSFSLYIEGNFPSLIKTQLTKKNGWTKKSYESNLLGIKHNYYSYEDGFDLAFVNKNTLFLSNQNMAFFLEAFFSPFAIAKDFSHEIETKFESAFRTLNESLLNKNILFYISEPKELLRILIPFDADFALDELYIIADTEENNYILDIDFIFSDPRAIRPALLLFKIAFYNYPIDIEQISETQILLKGLEFSLDMIISNL